MPESHTATEQWQSFELRMRQRRFERCLVRAAAALDADLLDAAKEALEEAQTLRPDDPRLPDLAGRLAIAEAPPPVIPVEPPVVVIQQPGTSRRWMWVAALIAMSAVAGWFAAGGHVEIPRPSSLIVRYTPEPPAVSPTDAVPAASPSASAAATEAPPETEPAPVAAADATIVPAAEKSLPTVDTPPGATASVAPSATPTATTGPEPSRTPVAETRVTTPPAPPPPIDKRTADVRNDAALPSKPAPLTAPVGSPVTVPPVATDAAVQPALTLPDLPPAAAPPPRSTTAPDTTAARPAATSAPIASPPAADTAITDERLVRATLSVYAAAFNRLDAAAARAVWPSVDQRALARAFDGLLSQSITLGQCDVRVSGASAHAECTGTAKWTPKVGGGTQSASRRWRFDLRNTGTDWIIVQANVR